MDNSNKEDQEAARIIAECAEKLLSLKAGKPMRWRQLFARAIKRTKPRGRPVQTDKNIRIVADIVGGSGRVLLKERTKETEGQKGRAAKIIARRNGASVRQVETLNKELNFSNLPALPIRRKVILDGVAMGIAKRLAETDKRELEARRLAVKKWAEENGVKAIRSK